MKKLFLLLFLSLSAQAQTSNFSIKLINVNNPSGSPIFSQVVNINTKAGYSIHCVVTGSLTFTGTILGSNQFDALPGQQQFTSIANTIQTISNLGFIWDVSSTHISYVEFEMSNFTGSGTSQCYLTAKDI
jgi:hypothetical protein